MPNRLIFPSDLSAAPQMPCLSAFRLKDMHREMFQPENILQENDSPKTEGTSVRLKHSNPRLKHSQAQSFSRNAHGQGVCEQAEAFEGFFKAFPIECDKRPYPTEKSKISYFSLQQNRPLMPELDAGRHRCGSTHYYI